MAIEFHVYNATNTVKLGELSEHHDAGFVADLRVPGTMIVSLDAVSTVDRALLAPGRIVRVNDGANDLEAYIVQDEPQEIATSGEIPVVHYKLRHLLTWLGHQLGGAGLWPYGGLGGLEQSPRWFGPMSFDFPPVVRPEPTTDGPLTRSGWPDARAERFVFDTRAVYRRFLTGAPALIGPSRMIFTAAWWTEVRVWFDGAELTALSSPLGDTTIHQYDLPYDGDDHVICFDAWGDPPAGKQNSLGWCWGQLVEDENGDLNRLGGRMFRTFNSTTFIGPVAPTVPYWQAWEEWTTYPGVTVGFVMEIALLEAQARGLLPSVTWDFDFDLDSEGAAWLRTFARAFRMQKLGHLLDALTPFLCEPEMTPAGLLRLHQQRGTDKTATITISTGYELAAARRGPRATRYLYETEGDFGQVINAAAEAALGLAMEDVVQLGEDINADAIEEAIDAQLAVDAATYSEIEVGFPDGVVPYGAGAGGVFLGDIVECVSDVDGTVVDVRLVSFTGELVDDNGTIEWSGVAEQVLP